VLNANRGMRALMTTTEIPQKLAMANLKATLDHISTRSISDAASAMANLDLTPAPRTRVPDEGARLVASARARNYCVPRAALSHIRQPGC
jgi:hypothetical protein